MVPVVLVFMGLLSPSYSEASMKDFGGKPSAEQPETFKQSPNFKDEKL